MNLRYVFAIKNDGISAKHHLVFWLVYFTFNTLRWGSYYGDLYFSLKGNIVEFPIHIALCYFTIYFLIPKLIYKRKIILFSSLIILLIFTLTFFKYQLTYWFVSQNVWPEGPEKTVSFTFNYALENLNSDPPSTSPSHSDHYLGWIAPSQMAQSPRDMCAHG
ncbi:MAG TPA: hypothetical protein ENH91_03835, partial [Leeuwenhoekiella sp.]|nr:hypothetical protein [Leeuwenhoekiella sp.]